MFSSCPFVDGLKMSQSVPEGRTAEINANSETFKHPGDATKQLQTDSRKRGSSGLSGPELAGTQTMGKATLCVCVCARAGGGGSEDRSRTEATPTTEGQ